MSWRGRSWARLPGGGGAQCQADRPGCGGQSHGWQEGASCSSGRAWWRGWAGVRSSLSSLPAAEGPLDAPGRLRWAPSNADGCSGPAVSPGTRLSVPPAVGLSAGMSCGTCRWRRSGPALSWPQPGVGAHPCLPTSLCSCSPTLGKQIGGGAGEEVGSRGGLWPEPPHTCPSSFSPPGSAEAGCRGWRAASPPLPAPPPAQYALPPSCLFTRRAWPSWGCPRHRPVGWAPH